MEQRKVLLTGGNLLQAHMWKGLLETSGIEVDLRGEALMGGVGELPVDLQTVELWIDMEHLNSAQSRANRNAVNLIEFVTPESTGETN